MIGYVDASACLAYLFNEQRRIKRWQDFSGLISSELLRLECLRTLDRLRSRAVFDPETIVLQRDALFGFLRHVSLVPLTPWILESSEASFPTPAGTLDAIHLASALVWQQSAGTTLAAFLTHDTELARAARSLGLSVVGC